MAHTLHVITLAPNSQSSYINAFSQILSKLKVNRSMDCQRHIMFMPIYLLILYLLVHFVHKLHTLYTNNGWNYYKVVSEGSSSSLSSSFIHPHMQIKIPPSQNTEDYLKKLLINLLLSFGLSSFNSQFHLILVNYLSFFLI